jgi:hypothetical protein
MHASINFNPSPVDVLDYHEEKVKQQLGECIGGENFLKEHSKLSYDEKLYSFELRAGYNDTVKKKMFHTALQFGVGQDIPNEKMARIGHEYLREMGFGDQPYLLYRHRDSAQEHLHLVAANIDSSGKRIGVSLFAMLRSMELSERLAHKHGLITAHVERAEDIPAAVQNLKHGLQVLYPVMNRILEEVVPNYRYTNLGELNAILRLHYIEASRGKEHTVTYQRKGLHYHPLKADGQPVKEYLAARRFPSRPTLTNLEKRFEANQVLRARHRESLIVSIDYALAGKALSLEALKQALAKQKVSLVVGAGDERRTWWVDHRNKTVFEGEALGKNYSFGAMQGRLVTDEAYQQQESQRQTQKLRQSF